LILLGLDTVPEGWMGGRHMLDAMSTTPDPIIAVRDRAYELASTASSRDGAKS
jgi:hypothetical protein